ncbi:MAG: polyprenyl synthetase family protein [Desulfobacterales bacterium]
MNDLKSRILHAVEDDLTQIEIALSDNLNPYLEQVSQTARHILFSGGKRLRPLLLVLSARICGYRGTYDTTFSTIFEYLHAATLLHDDLVDDATLRRGKPVAHSKWGNPIAVLVGDFLFARALSIAAETKLPEIIGIVAAITEDMSQGEIHQLMVKGKIDLSETEYHEIIRRKTAVLIQGACRSGALIAQATKTQEKALSTYGLDLGMAFQLADDLLDYTSETGVLGKAVGADLREGKLTLPVIYALDKADSSDRAWMETIIAAREFSEDDFQELIEKLHHYGGLAYTRQVASQHVARAKEALQVFDPSATKDILLDVADYAMIRKT